MENYKQKYEAALEQAKQELKACGSLNCDAARQIFRLFPELKKNEDELIKEELIHFLETCRDPRFVGNRKQNEWISWLDKLIVKHEDKFNKCTCDNEVLVGYDCTSVDLSKFCDEIQEFSDMLEDKPKPYWDGWYEAMEWIRTHGNPFEKQSEQKSFDCKKSALEPKFKVGNWIVNDFSKNIFLIKYYHSGYCTLEDTEGKFYNPCLPPNNAFHLWTINDAKNGDVLVCENKRPFIFKDLLDPNHPDCPVAYCGIDYGNSFIVSSGVNFWTDDNVEPATKEQRDLLFQKMEEAGYKWDDIKKKLIRYEN